MTAFDLKTGRLIWKALDDKAAYSSPFAATLGGVKQVLLMTRRGMVSLAQEKGNLLWRYEMDTPYDQNIMTPVVSGDLVLVSGYRRGTVAVRVTGQGGKVSSKTLGEVLEKDVMTYGEMMGQIWKFIHQEELTVEQNTSTNE